MASFNVWTANRAFLVKCRVPKITATATGASFVKTGQLRVGVFEKTASGWAVKDFARNSIGFEPAELGQFLVPNQTTWSFNKSERVFQSSDGGGSFGGGGGVGGGEAEQILQKALTVNVNDKTQTVHVNLQVTTKEGEELHNVSTDLKLGNWLAFKEVARFSIPLLCGFDAATFRSL